MTKIYSIRTAHGDVRVLKTFKVTGKDKEDCFNKAQKELEFFTESLELELE